jgi:hypothetical protein
MARFKPILIGCPQYGKLVRGEYACDEDGAYRLGPDGTFALALARCGHDGGRCMQTLCVLHRFNRRGGSSWYPTQILAMRQGRRGRRKNSGPPNGQASAGTDLLW